MVKLLKGNIFSYVIKLSLLHNVKLVLLDALVSFVEKLRELFLFDEISGISFLFCLIIFLKWRDVIFPTHFFLRLII